MHQTVDLLETLPDLLKTLRPRYHYLPRHEYQKSHLRVLQPVHQPREQLRHKLDLRRIHLLVYVVQLHLLQVDWELHIRRCHHILDLELRVLHHKPHLLNYTRVLTTRQLTLLLRTRTRYHHLATAEDQTSCLRVTQTHYHRCETVRVVLSSLALPGYLLEVQLTPQIYSAHHVLNFWVRTLRHLQPFILHSTNHIIMGLDSKLAHLPPKLPSL